MSAISRWTIALSIILSSAPALATPITVPEPGTLGLLAIGVAGLVATTFRKRK